MTNAVNIAQGGTNNVSWRNRIINGAMVIDQRNAGASVGASGAWSYPVDRFGIYATLTSKFTGQQSATAPTGFVNSLLITSSAATTPGASDQYLLKHVIEGYNVADLGFGTANAAAIALSFWVRSSVTGTFSGAFKNSAGNRSYVFTYSVSVANTWEQKTIPITGDTTGTWLTTNGAGLQIWFDLGGGSTYRTSAGSWVAGDFQGATGAVSVVGTSGATFYITGVQLEAGSVASPFEFRDYGQELFMCQRYCEAIFLSGSGADRDLGMGAGNGGSGAFQAFVVWKVQKRAAPTVALAGASNFYVHVPGNFRNTCSSVSAVDPTEFGSHIQGVSSSGTLNSGQACFFAAVPSTAVITASAEL